MMTFKASILSACLVVAGCGTGWTTYDVAPSEYTQYNASTPAISEIAARRGNLFAKGFEAIKAGNYAAAEPYLTEHLAKNSTDSYALLAMGTVMEQTDRSVDALTYYRLATQYGAAMPLGETLALEGTEVSEMRTVRDLAMRNIARLAPAR